MKNLLTVLVGLLLLAGCSTAGGATNASQPAAAPVPADLTGTWKQNNSNSTDSWQEAVIKDDAIEINWVSNKGDTRSLYWAGSYTAPTEPGNSYEWESKNDHSKTDGAILASSDDTKKFTVAGGVLSWHASAMGTDMVIKSERS